MKVCRSHKPADQVFAPFLGQQVKFFQRKERVVFFGGAVAGGKSICLKMKFAQQLRVEFERTERARAQGKQHKSVAWGVYFRRTSPDFKQAVQRSYEYFKALDPEAKYNGNDHTWTFPSCGDAVFEFAHLEHEKDKYKYKSREFTYIAFDELTEFTESQYDYLDTRLRTSDPFLEPYLQNCSASNPDGEGLIWVRERFIEAAEPEQVVRIETELRDGRIVEHDQVFIPAKLEDNPILMESGRYEASLMNKRPEVREALLSGNWWIAPGAFLANVWSQDLHVVEDHDIPRGAKVFRGGDWGINAPSSIGWFYEDADGGLTMFAHLRTVGLTVDKVVPKMEAIEREWGLWDEEGECSGLNFARNPLDSACFGVGQGLAGARTIAKDFASLGFRWKPARKGPGSRLNGAAQIVKRLTKTIPAAFDGADHPTERERPMLRFMQSCTSPIKTVPVLRTDPNNVDDVDTDGDDHDWDMLMYTCLERPVASPEEDPDDGELEDEPGDLRTNRRATMGSGPWTR